MGVPMTKKPRGKPPCEHCPPEGKLQDSRVQHIIVLMMENRSFDHMLGYCRIPKVNGVWDKPEFGTTQDAAAVEDLKDPGHDSDDVKLQLYGPNPEDDPWQNDPREMSKANFVKSYEGYNKEKPEAVMNCFSPDKVPVLTSLAHEFAVCNQWYSSIPGPTLPNRLYAHAGTSKTRLDMAAEEFYTYPTIYEVLDYANIPSTIYCDGWSATSTFWNLMKHQDQYFGTLDDFFQDCYDNRLPRYCFLEPRYGSSIEDGTFRPQNDQHPDSDVNEGEQLLYSVYKAIRSNRRVWTSSMLVIVYDEHGGLFDHVVPPKATPPGDGPSKDPPFNFDRYGVRVPAVIVSPYISRNTVLNDCFDHTSLIATARKLLTGHWQDDCLGQRAARANTFDGVLNLPASSPRMEHIETTQIADLPPLKLEPHPVTRGDNDKAYLERPVNHLQIMHVKQALLLNCRLPHRMQVKPPKSYSGQNLTKKSTNDDFKCLKTQTAEDFIQSVKRAARNTALIKTAEECKKEEGQ